MTSVEKALLPQGLGEGGLGGDGIPQPPERLSYSESPKAPQRAADQMPDTCGSWKCCLTLLTSGAG